MGFMSEVSEEQANQRRNNFPYENEARKNSLLQQILKEQKRTNYLLGLISKRIR